MNYRHKQAQEKPSRRVAPCPPIRDVRSYTAASAWWIRLPAIGLRAAGWTGTDPWRTAPRTASLVLEGAFLPGPGAARVPRPRSVGATPAGFHTAAWT